MYTIPRLDVPSDYRVPDELSAGSINRKIDHYNNQVEEYRRGSPKNRINNKLNKYLKIAIKVSSCILFILLIALVGVLLSPAIFPLAGFTVALTLLLIGGALAVSSLIAFKISNLVISMNIKNYLESGSKLPQLRERLETEKKALTIAIGIAIDDYVPPVPPRRTPIFRRVYRK